MGRPRPAEASLIGRRLAQFLVVGRIGEGGMGIVYRALDEKLRRPVALKVLAERYALDDRNKEALFREARSAAAVVHPNVAAIHDVEEIDGIAFLAMELVDGRTLREALLDGPFAATDALRVVLGVARGLARAHEIGVVHRDLKPENVMLTRAGDVKILDFGIASVVHEPEPTLASDLPVNAEGPTALAHSEHTDSARIMGTPAYMSPEQTRGTRVGPQADVFATGAMLFELLTGEQPFASRTRPHAPQSWGGDDSPDWRRGALPPNTSPQVTAIVDRCLRLRSEERFADGRVLATAIEEASFKLSPHGRRAWRRAVPALAVALVISAGALLVARSMLRSSGQQSPPAASPALRSRVLVAHAPANISIAVSGGDVFVPDGDRLLHRPLDGDADPVPTDLPSELRGWRIESLSPFPDEGHLLVDARHGVDAGTFDLSLKTQVVRRLTLPLAGGVVSPDGKHVSYVAHGSVVIASLDGTERSIASTGYIFGGGLCWSPNGDALAFVDHDATAPAQEASIDIVNVDGRNRHRVARDSSALGEGPAALAWPDEHRLVYARQSFRTDHTRRRGTELVQVSLDGRGAAVGEPTVLHAIAGSGTFRLVATAGALVACTTTGEPSLRVARLSDDGQGFDAPPSIVLRDRDPRPIGWLSADRLLFFTTGERDERLPLFVATLSGALVDARPFEPLPSSRGGWWGMAGGVGFGLNIALLADGSVLSWERQGDHECAFARHYGDGKREDVFWLLAVDCPLAMSCTADLSRCVAKTQSTGETRFSVFDVKRGEVAPALASIPETDAFAPWTLSRDGRTLVYATRRLVARVDVGTRVARQRPRDPEDVIGSLVFGRDDRTLYGTGEDPDGTYTIARFDEAWNPHLLYSDVDVWFTTPRPSSDGRAFAFYSRDYSSQVVVVEPAR